MSISLLYSLKLYLTSTENIVESSPHNNKNKTGISRAVLLKASLLLMIMSNSQKNTGTKIAKSLKVIVWAKGRIKIRTMKEIKLINGLFSNIFLIVSKPTLSLRSHIYIPIPSSSTGHRHFSGQLLWETLKGSLSLSYPDF